MNIKTIVIILPFIGSTLVAGGDLHPGVPRRYTEEWVMPEGIRFQNVGVTPMDVVFSDSFVNKLKNVPPDYRYKPDYRSEQKLTLNQDQSFNSPILLSGVTFTCKNGHSNEHLFDDINRVFINSKFLPTTKSEEKERYGGRWLNFFFAIECDAELNPQIVSYNFGGNVPGEYGAMRLIAGRIDPKEFESDLIEALQTMRE